MWFDITVASDLWRHGRARVLGKSLADVMRSVDQNASETTLQGTTLISDARTGRLLARKVWSNTGWHKWETF